MSMIVFVRHGESEGNEAGLLTGQKDVALTKQGKEQARATAEQLRTITFQSAYSSTLRRAQSTLSEILVSIHQPAVPVTINAALDERDFGSLTGTTKSSLKAALGEDSYKAIVKGWNEPAPGGESLHDVQNRVLPYFQSVILADALSGHKVLVVSHHQTLRALLKYIDNISDDDVSSLQFQNGQAIAYAVSAKSGALTPCSLGQITAQ